MTPMTPCASSTTMTTRLTLLCVVAVPVVAYRACCSCCVRPGCYPWLITCYCKTMAPPTTMTGIQINAVYDPDGDGNDRVFVYSYNNGGRQRPEFLALNVPHSKVEQVARTINYLATRVIKHGESVSTVVLFLLTNEIEGERKAQLFETHIATIQDPNSPLFELVPRFNDCNDDDDDDNNNTPTEWGSLPAAPNGRQELVESIISVWMKKNRKTFVLFVNGNPGNCSLANIKYIDLGVALCHVNDWKVDWDMHLTSSEQKSYVREHNRYFSKLAKVLFRPKEVCAACGLIDVGRLMRCGKCKSTWYCGATCQHTDWSNHKSECKNLQALRNNKPRP